eukprot:TRINITY_DN14748_c0_g1_i1.p1 TRINITY_DN14748_c0_g1~~TRINITY_DN14748_c0_g1_i1.p1  ORF type:complete len:304 (-),score=29.83 TRINITY_DN14748_c0_g1_i1:1454-2365(-)
MCIRDSSKCKIISITLGDSGGVNKLGRSAEIGSAMCLTSKFNRSGSLYVTKAEKEEIKFKLNLSNTTTLLKKVSRVQLKKCYKKGLTKHAYLELTRLFERAIRPGRKGHRTTRRMRIRRESETVSVAREVVKLDFDKAELVAEFESAVLNNEPRDVFNEKVKEFATLVFDYQQRNLILSPYRSQKLIFDLIGHCPVVNEFIESMALAANFVVDKTSIKEWERYKEAIDKDIINYRAVNKTVKVPLSFYKEESMRILSFLFILDSTRKKFIDSTAFPVIYSDRIVTVVRNELLKKVLYASMYRS